MRKSFYYNEEFSGYGGTYEAVARIDIEDGEIVSIYGGTRRHTFDNEGYLHRKEWDDPRSLRTALNFVEYQLPHALDDIREYYLN